MDDKRDLGQILSYLPQAYEKWNPDHVKIAEKNLDGADPADPNARELAEKLYNCYINELKFMSKGELSYVDIGIALSRKLYLQGEANKLREKYGLEDLCTIKKSKEKKSSMTKTECIFRIYQSSRCLQRAGGQ